MEGVAAKVAVSRAPYAIDKPYDYLVPRELEGRLLPGMRVAVPFGAGNRSSDGIVLALGPVPEGISLKVILSCLDDEPVLDHSCLQLALWMRERCFCTVAQAVKAMLPAGLYFALRDSVALVPGQERDTLLQQLPAKGAVRELAELLLAWGGRGDMEQIRAAFGTRDPNPAIRALMEGGFAVLETSAQRGIGDKQEKLAVLAMPAEEAMALVSRRRGSAPLRYSVTELLCTLGAASAKELCYFTGASPATLRSLEKSGILRLEQQEVLRRPRLDEVEPADPPVLNQEQQAACDGLTALCTGECSAAALLYGVTGSGKTQVYLALIRRVLDSGRGAIVLVPEIALTPQLLRIFAAHFGKEVAVLHSSLRTGERYDEWKRIRRGEARVVVGTRSAVFAPIRSLGLIILDEEQEGTYKSENAPRYHARDVAKYRCVQHKALLLLGSATPAVESMYWARQDRYHLFVLRQRYNSLALPQVEIVDMRRELREGNGTSISGRLERELRENLFRGEQSILFLNRRGANRLVSCGECGSSPSCPRCSVSLTYHSANGRLMCHHCGYSQPMPPVCPECGGILNFIGIGTQRVQEDLEELFPGVEILRMDTDTISASHPHQALLDRFQKERIPILVGTQMVAKGLDFDNVTLVGVISADFSLYTDDFRASERTFSQITQVVGRAGRGGKRGRALIQTYSPENDVIQDAARQDYDAFYCREIQLRRLRQYPPFRDILVFTASGVEEAGVLRAAARLRQALGQALKERQAEYLLLGPAPAAVLKINGRFRYRVTVSGRVDKPLRSLAAHLLRAAQQDKENKGISVFADLNPLD